MKNEELLKKVSTAVGFVFLAFAVMTFYMSYTNYREKLDNLQASMFDDVNVTAPAEQTAVTPDSSDVTEDNMRELQATALSAATKIADLQNESTELMSHTSAPKEEIDQIIANRTEMCKYFRDSHFGECWFSSDEQYDTTWHVIMPLDYTMTYVPVVWECTDEDGNLFAYATAVYQSDGIFDDVTVLVTNYGASKQPYTKADDTLLDERSLEEWLGSVDHILQRSGQSIYDEGEIDPNIDITFPDKWEEGHEVENREILDSMAPGAESVSPSAPEDEQLGGDN